MCLNCSLQRIEEIMKRTRKSDGEMKVSVRNKASITFIFIIVFSVLNKVCVLHCTAVKCDSSQTKAVKLDLYS